VESNHPFQALAQLLEHDPSERGVAGLRPWGGTCGADALMNSARQLLGAQAVAIVTGFYIPSADPPAAETDGPLGALALTRALGALGKQVRLIADPFAAPLLECCLPQEDRNVSLQIVPWTMLEFAENDKTARHWIDDFLATHGPALNALVSIERVGPAHSLTSVRPDEAAEFAASVPPAQFNCRHNMRGTVIDHFTPPLDLLFEQIKAFRPDCFTLGLGDGGNEIGLGCFSWSQLRGAIRRSPGAQIACRIATDEVITAGISNWGAYALVAAMAQLESSMTLASVLSVDEERAALRRMVDEAGAVDGVTLTRSYSVDGVAEPEYLAHLGKILDCVP
jgi:hypothetical protein